MAAPEAVAGKLREAIIGERPPAEAVRRAGVLVLGLAAGAFLIAAEFTTISSTEILTASCDDLATRSVADGCKTTGGEHHGYTLVVLGLLAAVMAWGAGRRGSRPAAALLAGIGLVAAAVVLIADLPTLDETGTMGQLFSDVETHVGTGFWLESAGAVAALVAGALGLLGRSAAPAAAVMAVHSVPEGANGRPAADAVPDPDQPAPAKR